MFGLLRTTRVGYWDVRNPSCPWELQFYWYGLSWCSAALPLNRSSLRAKSNVRSQLTLEQSRTRTPLRGQGAAVGSIVIPHRALLGLDWNRIKFQT